ncbi:MAG: excisionase family DNA-binding protein [Pseudonocardia sp.]
MAERLCVSVATVYRAIEDGSLRAMKFGAGRGALRVEEDAVREYMQACQEAAARRMGSEHDPVCLQYAATDTAAAGGVS